MLWFVTQQVEKYFSPGFAWVQEQSREVQKKGCQQLLLMQSQNHRFLDLFELRGILKITQFQPPCLELVNLSLDQVAQRPINLTLNTSRDGNLCQSQKLHLVQPVLETNWSLASRPAASSHFCKRPQQKASLTLCCGLQILRAKIHSIHYLNSRVIPRHKHGAKNLHSGGSCLQPRWGKLFGPSWCLSWGFFVAGDLKNRSLNSAAKNFLLAQETSRSGRSLYPTVLTGARCAQNGRVDH